MVHLMIISVNFEKLIVAQLLEHVPIPLHNLKVHYRVYKSHALAVIMRYFQVIFWIHSNNTLHCTLRLRKWYLSHWYFD
jgi:hypothetical protein